MGKLVILNIGKGDFENGFPVFLQISEEDGPCFADAHGKLPAVPNIWQCYENWQQPYTRLVTDFIRSSARLGDFKVKQVSVQEIRTAKENLKFSLNDWLNSPEMSAVLRTIDRALKDESEAIRFIIKSERLELQCLPWHLWDDFFQHYHRAEVSLSLPLGRRQKVDCREKAKVLAVFGKRETIGNDTKINLDKDWELLQKHLADDAELIRLLEPELEDVYEKLDSNTPDLFFFGGHSSTEENGEKGLIELNTEESIIISDLKPALRDAVRNGLQLAIFNSCDGLGIARELADVQIPYIIVMREPVPDVVAQKFLQRFLEAFTGERSVCLAVRRAREKIHSLEPRFPGVTSLPIVFQNPAVPPLLGKEFRRITTKVKTQTENTIVVPKPGNQSQILWLPTAIPNLPENQESSSSQINNLSNSESEQSLNVTRPLSSSQHQQEGIKSKLICSKGHENSDNNKFCIYCGESLNRPTTLISYSAHSSSEVPPTPEVEVMFTTFTPRPSVVNSNTNQGNSVKSVGVGSILGGRYEIIKVLGVGGFGQTYLAEDKDALNRYCVVKKLSSPYNDPSILQVIRRLFETEARVMQQLEHPQIPRLLAYFEEEQEFYLVQEFIDGDNLNLEIIPGKIMKEPYVILLVNDVLEILRFVHYKGIIHRDIKPSNLIRRKEDGKLFLIDFGAVKKVTNFNMESQATGTSIGTPGYTSPEQMYGKPTFSSDIYSLGIVCIQALTGILPHQLQQNSLYEINWHNQAKVSPQLAKILDKMVEHELRNRYQSVDEVLAYLTPLIQRS
jgi:serine/threonine-protein kinase